MKIHSAFNLEGQAVHLSPNDKGLAVSGLYMSRFNLISVDTIIKRFVTYNSDTKNDDKQKWCQSNNNSSNSPLWQEHIFICISHSWYHLFHQHWNRKTEEHLRSIRDKKGGAGYTQTLRHWSAIRLKRSTAQHPSLIWPIKQLPSVEFKWPSLSTKSPIICPYWVR